MDRSYEQLRLSNENMEEYIEALEEKIGDMQEQYTDLEEKYFELMDKYSAISFCLNMLKKNNKELWNMLIENEIVEGLEEIEKEIEMYSEEASEYLN